ncbi:MAG TPA: transglycosylase [Xanthobacteraceae bacterium]|jgi:hypothetical protein|nr:transglycosylase [Xanthobacteraceae bacterium]
MKSWQVGGIIIALLIAYPLFERDSLWRHVSAPENASLNPQEKIPDRVLPSEPAASPSVEQTTADLTERELRGASPGYSFFEDPLTVAETPAKPKFSYLTYYAYSEVPPDAKPAETILDSMQDIPVGAPAEEIKRVCDVFGLDANYMKAVAKIESGFGSTQRTGSYIGLYQLSDYEFDRYGYGNIVSPRDNAVAAAYKFATAAILFEISTHKKATLTDLYLIHQQGTQGAAEHVSHPERVAWKSMCATDEGHLKGEKWCKRAIWQNTLPDIKHEWKSVEKLTSAAFIAMWDQRVHKFYARYTETVAAQ